MSIKPHLGDIYCIPLPNGKYAFGRIYRDACIAIYKQISDSPNEIPLSEEYQFIVGVYEDVLKSGRWKKVFSRPFENDRESWPPPMCVKDSITGNYSVYYRSEFRPSTSDECSKMEEAAVWEAEHIVDRIMGINTWHER